MDRFTNEVHTPARAVVDGRARWTATEDNGVEVFVLHPAKGGEVMLFPMDTLLAGLAELRAGYRGRERALDRLDAVAEEVVRATIRDAIAPTTKGKADADEVAERVHQAVQRAGDLIMAGGVPA